MARSLCSLVSIFLLILAYFSSCSGAVKFTLTALAPGSEGINKRCLSQYIGKDVVVRGQFEVSDGDHQDVSVQVTDDSKEVNQYYSKSDISGKGTFTFNTHTHGAVQVCFTNTLKEGFQPSPQLFRVITLALDTGAEAKEDKDFEEKDQHLKPVEIELSRLESLSEELVDEMEYMISRLSKMRNTNESTNDRVKWFSSLTIFLTIGVGIWQIFYLKQFFKSKKLI